LHSVLLGSKAFCDAEEDKLCYSDDSDTEPGLVEEKQQSTQEDKENVSSVKKVRKQKKKKKTGRRVSYKNWEAATEECSIECKINHLYTVSLCIMYVGSWK